MSKPGILSSAALSTPVSVLLAEYHDDTRALYGDYLKRAGCTVEEAADGREALAKAIARRYDIVITETRLPGIDGYSLCQLLRRDASTMSTPVIVVTGDAMLCDLERARAAGADATLVKPCLPQALLEEMQKLMERRQSRHENVDSTAARADDSPPAVERVGARRPILSRIHRRGPTTTPPLAPPNLRCPVCDKELVYHHSNVGGVSARHPEQWDYFECPTQCGTFEYRQRTRKIRRSGDANC